MSSFGPPAYRAELLDAVYDELRHLAAARMRQEFPGHTLQPTALVHEAWVRLVGNKPKTWTSRAHFLGAAAKAMRSILVDSARARNAQKRGGGRLRFTWQDDCLGEWAPEPDELLAVHEALQRLAALDPRRSQLVELRFFAGMTMREAAIVMDISERSAYGLWEHARAWLFRDLNP